MKYRIGDEVKIKTWNNMEEEFGLNYYKNIKCGPNFMKYMEETIKDINTDRILTIKKIKNNYFGDYYIMKGFEKYYKDDYEWQWSDLMIECEVYSIPIKTRFEILDL